MVDFGVRELSERRVKGKVSRAEVRSRSKATGKGKKRVEQGASYGCNRKRNQLASPLCHRKGGLPSFPLLWSRGMVIPHTVPLLPCLPVVKSNLQTAYR
jgi:hypothetical protein